MHATEFYKNRLSFHERKLYAAISAAWSSASPTCEVSPLLRGGAIRRTIEAVTLDNPGLFAVDPHAYTMQTRYCFIPLRRMLFHPLCDPREAERLGRELRLWQRRVCAQIPPFTASAPKAWMLMDYLARTVRYGGGERAEAHTIVGAARGEAVCSGLAKAYKFLCDGAGLPCIVASGTLLDAKTIISHAWNIVEIDGRCQHIDLTSQLDEALERGKASADFLHGDAALVRAGYTWNREVLPPCPD